MQIKVPKCLETILLRLFVVAPTTQLPQQLLKTHPGPTLP
jgi:hypothetical protein